MVERSSIFHLSLNYLVCYVGENEGIRNEHESDFGY